MGRVPRALAGLVVMMVVASACSDAGNLVAANSVDEEVLGPAIEQNPLVDPVAPEPLPSTPPLPTLPSTVPPPDPVTVVVAGNLGICNRHVAEVTAAIDDTAVTILTPGDLSSDGSNDGIEQCFLPVFGDDLDRILAVPGDRDLAESNGAAFYEVIANTPTRSTSGDGWFVTTLGGWQLIGLNSNCDAIGGCDQASEQFQWLDQVLRDQPATCRAVMWHDPRFSTATEVEPAADMGAIYGRLDGAGVDVLFTGGPANYERLGPLRPDGEVATDGIVSFNVGSMSGDRFGPNKPGTRARSGVTNGYLLVVFEADAYSWEFVSTGGAGVEFADSGSGSC